MFARNNITSTKSIVFSKMLLSSDLKAISVLYILVNFEGI